MEILITLFVANAILHVISFYRIRAAKAPNSLGVLAFAIINLVLALLLTFVSSPWVIWCSLIFPILGASGLMVSTILKRKGTWPDYVILALDISIIILALNISFKNFLL